MLVEFGNLPRQHLAVDPGALLERLGAQIGSSEPVGFDRARERGHSHLCDRIELIERGPGNIRSVRGLAAAPGGSRRPGGSRGSGSVHRDR